MSEAVAKPAGFIAKSTFSLRYPSMFNGLSVIYFWACSSSDPATQPPEDYVRYKFTSTTQPIDPLYLWSDWSRLQQRSTYFPTVYDTVEISFIADPEGSGSFDESIVTAPASGVSRTISISEIETLVFYINDPEYTFTGFSSLDLGSYYTGDLHINLSGLDLEATYGDSPTVATIPAGGQDDFVYLDLSLDKASFTSEDRSVDPNTQTEPTDTSTGFTMGDPTGLIYSTFDPIRSRQVRVRTWKEHSSLPGRAQRGRSFSLIFDNDNTPIWFTRYFEPWASANLTP